MKNYFIDAGDFYEDAWKKVDSLEQKGLPKSAYEEVVKIYTRAKKDENIQHFLKAVIHKIKYQSQLEEDGFNKAVVELNKEIAEAKTPQKQILNSMIGELYWQYYSHNRYQFQNRSKTSDFSPSDISTWDLNKLVETCVSHYLASLEDPDQLQKIDIESINLVLYQDFNDDSLRASLYDFLAHRAVDFFSAEEPQLIRPKEQFTLNNNAFLLPAKEFVSHTIVTGDSLAFKFYALTILQDLTKFHLYGRSGEAFVDVELKRLNFVRTNSVNPEKDTIYLKTLEELKDKYKETEASSEISYYIARVYFERGNKYNPRQSEDFKWDLKKAYDICSKAIETSKDGVGKASCRALQSEIQAKSLQLTMESANLPDKPFLALANYKNVEKIYLKVFKTDKDDLEKIERSYKNQKNDYREYAHFLVEFFKKKSPVSAFEQRLPDDGDFQQHATEVKIPELPLGEYVVFAATNPEMEVNNNAIAYNFTSATRISYIHRNSKAGSMEVYVVDRESGEAIPNATVKVFYQSYNQKKQDYEFLTGGIYLSDKDGLVSITENDKRFFVEISSGKDVFYARQKGDGYRYPIFYTGHHYEESFHYPVRAYYFTDRAIYRPGQTIYFKGILLQADKSKQHQILKNTAVVVSLRDVNYQEVVQLKLKTNNFGTFSGSFTAPNSGLNGEMRLVDNYNGSHSFSVEDYKRPKFEVKLEEPQETYRLGDSVQIIGSAKAFAGNNIDNASFKYRVVRKAIIPLWWCYWRGYFPETPSMEIANGTGQTDDKGELKVNFSAIPDLTVSRESNPTYNYTIYTDVTDINGETRSTEKTISIGYNALSLKTDVPETVFEGEKTSFNLTTANLSGIFTPAKGTITIYKLKDAERVLRKRKWDAPDKFILSETEHKTLFPLDPYKDEDNAFKRPREKKVMEISFDTDKDKTFAFTDLNKWPQGKYVVEINSKDKFGTAVQELVFFTFFDKQNKKSIANKLELLSMIKTVAEPGEKASFLAGSADELRVLFELEKEGKIIHQEWLRLKDEQKLIEIPIKEEYRGNIGVHLTFIKYNRLFTNTQTITIPFTNKQLDISFETFRNKLLPGEKETWKIRIKGKSGEKVAAEMVATLYDASLNVFRPNRFNFNIYNAYYARLQWVSSLAFDVSNSNLYQKSWYSTIYVGSRDYDRLNWFGYAYYGRAYRDAVYLDAPMAEGEAVQMKHFAPVRAMKKETAANKVMEEESMSSEIAAEPQAQSNDQSLKPKQTEDLTNVKSRTNFNETAFFYPHLETDEKGDVLISFTIPEALTRWKMLGFAHTEDLKYGIIENEVVTQKELMVVPNVPRFFREADRIDFSVKISNLADKDLSGQAQLMLFDALTMKPVDGLLKNTDSQKSFETKKGQSTSLSWSLSIPEGIQAITYRVAAKAGSFSDGEEMAVPVLTNRMLVTETLPLPIRSKQTKVFTLDKMVNNQSATLRNHNLTLEFTSHPAWYAIQALPYLMEYPYECAEQTFSRFYANSIASHIANSNPKIKSVFDSWKQNGSNPSALASNLEKNQELKSLLLEETPWVRDAQNESERKKRVAILFDLNRMGNELDRALSKLMKMQYSNGGWPWFEGMRENRYITQHIVTGIGHLDHLGVKRIRENNQVWNMTKKAILYLDQELIKEYQELKRLEKKGQIKMSDPHLHGLIIQYLYARSYFVDIPINGTLKEVVDYYKSQAKKYWLKNGIYHQGMLAIGLTRLGDSTTPKDIVKSLKERAQINEELGMYWKENWGYYWWQAPIETQALMIEVFDEVAKDQKIVDELKVWLLKQKQTQDWKTTKATTEACYALLLRGTNWLASEELVEVSLGDLKVDSKKLELARPEAGTGYFKTSWAGQELKKEMGKVTVKKNDEGVSWGALYWQYFEQLDKITPNETPLKLKKQVLVEKNTDKGPVITPITPQTSLKVGDLLKVRIELRVDRNMEYVHMKDMRASGLEPINVMSGYKYQDGLGYYESTRDAATNFFFDYLPKGTFVFEYPLRVTHRGDFSNGITSIQSMYAPEFASHSEGIRVKVE